MIKRKSTWIYRKREVFELRHSFSMTHLPQKKEKLESTYILIHELFKFQLMKNRSYTDLNYA